MASDYKQGTWLRHIASGHLAEIIIIAHWPDQNVTKYYAEWRSGDYEPIEFRSSKHNLDEYFVVAPAAQVLLGNKE